MKDKCLISWTIVKMNRGWNDTLVEKELTMFKELRKDDCKIWIYVDS